MPNPQRQRLATKDDGTPRECTLIVERIKHDLGDHFYDKSLVFFLEHGFPLSLPDSARARTRCPPNYIKPTARNPAAPT
jgi:hypothetical protein